MEISGTIKTIVYRSEANGFTVLELVDASGDEITAVGTLPLACVGESVELSGEWTEHRAYGMQFKADSYKSLSPATLAALKSYLASGLIKGVGEATAQNIVRAFGLETLSVLENEPERLTEVIGIGKLRAETIAASFLSQKQMRDTVIKLQELGVSAPHAVKLYKLLGEFSLPRIQENPYSLTEYVDSIGFKTADRIALSMGIAQDSPFRVQAGLRYVLSFAHREGHTFLPRERLIAIACDALNAEVRPVETALDDMILDRRLLYRMIAGVDAVFLPFSFFQENTCAKALYELSAAEAKLPFHGEDDIAKLEKQLCLSLAPQQLDAVRMALRNPVFVITGGPGTGKTTILRFVHELLAKQGFDVELCAPTGRAAKHMSEATGCEAKTIHRLLEYGFEEETFGRNAENPLKADAVIVDEMSMVDVPLLSALLRALTPQTRLIMVGDADQLPPVGPGNTLRDIIESGIIPVIRLTEIFRQAQESLIVTNAHRINAGKMPELDAKDADFRFEQLDDANALLGRLVYLCSGRSGALGTGDPFKDVQVLAPMKKGALGVHALNARLQAALNPPARHKKERQYGEVCFREGDKVMQVKNNYSIQWCKRVSGGVEDGVGVYNGDLGTILAIDPDEQSIHVLFDDERDVEYDFTQLEELSLAYCMSVHKSQGSEFPVVLLALAGGPPMLLNRNLLYTAITRARSRVYILGRRQSIAQMVNNAETKKRYSALNHLLKEAASARYPGEETP
ncbi:MAG: ATP-dependent RecD-like DNA helicase [Bacillota bacterium]